MYSLDVCRAAQQQTRNTTEHIAAALVVLRPVRVMARLLGSLKRPPNECLPLRKCKLVCPVRPGLPMSQSKICVRSPSKGGYILQFHNIPLGGGSLIATNMVLEESPDRTLYC